MDNIKLLYIQMGSKRTVQRRRNSKRQKRRSLKRQNRKYRKVMRGGGDDPLKNVKNKDLVSVVLQDNAYAKSYPAPSDKDITIICEVVSVENADPRNPKTVKLRITSEPIEFAYVYGGNSLDGIPVEFSDNFDIIYNPSEEPSKPAYSFRIYKRDDSGNLQVISGRTYTDIKVTEDNGSYVMTNSQIIKSVQPITKSR